MCCLWCLPLLRHKYRYFKIRLQGHTGYPAESFFFVYCGAKFVLRKGLTFWADRVTIQTTKNSLSTADTVFGEYLFDHSLSHRHARSTRKQWRQDGRKGCVSERKGAEMPRNERKQVLPNSLGARCRVFESPHSDHISSETKRFQRIFNAFKPFLCLLHPKF